MRFTNNGMIAQVCIDVSVPIDVSSCKLGISELNFSCSIRVLTDATESQQPSSSHPYGPLVVLVVVVAVKRGCSSIRADLM